MVADFMDREAISDLVNGISYKKGWHFSLFDEYLTITSMVPDSRGGRVEVSIYLRVYFGHIQNTRAARENLLLEIYYAIGALEGHERLEWFKVDGKHVYDPHPNGPDGSLRTQI